MIDEPPASGEGEQAVTPAMPVPRWRAPMALVTSAFVVLVLLVVVVLLILKVTRGSTTVQAPPVTQAGHTAVQEATSVPASAFDAVGAPVGESPSPTVLSGQPSLEAGGHPEVVFVGGEFCPYCAAERWALVVALGRFGTFSHLGSTSSSKYEAFGGTATFSFDGSSYRSSYATFSPVEMYGPEPSSDAPAGFPELDKVPTPIEALLKRYDSPPFSSVGGVLPFVDVADRLLVVGAAVGYSPGLIEGKSMSQIAGALSDPANPVSQAILGTANELTAAICSATGDRPQRVCDSAGVRAGTAQLGAG
ncbi:MAG TPA: DUF929 family protein [Acidimicrobiales bacterium]|nr:DUF929 family protein [Acidimicrobiales bacterium]